MTKTFRILSISLVVIFILGVSGITWFVHASTRPIEFSQKYAILSVETGTVELKKSGSDTWNAVTVDTHIESGDTVKTSEDAVAEVNLFDQGTARLDKASLITFEELAWDAEHPTVLKGKVFVETGRVWSRLMDFLSPESSYEVKTTSTIASVRGTSFFVWVDEAGKQDIYVDDHAVQLAHVLPDGKRNEVELGEGEMAVVDSPKAVVMERMAPPETMKQWIEGNRVRDEKFDDRVRERNRKEAAAMRRVDPTSPLYPLVTASEQVRMAMAPAEKKDELREQFVAGHMVDAFIASERHDSVGAERVLRATKQLGEHPQNPERAQRVLERTSLYFAAKKDQPSPEVIQVMKEAAPREALRLENIAERRAMFDAINPKNSIDSPSLPLQPIKPIEPLPPIQSLEPIQPSKLTEPLQPIQLLKPLQPTEVIQPPSDTNVVPMVKLVLIPDLFMIAQGKRTFVRSFLVNADGSRREVTALTEFGVLPELDGTKSGFMEQNVFVAVHEGKARIVAKTVEAGIVYKAEVGIGVFVP